MIIALHSSMISNTTYETMLLHCMEVGGSFSMLRIEALGLTMTKVNPVVFAISLHVLMSNNTATVFQSLGYLTHIGRY